MTNRINTDLWLVENDDAPLDQSNNGGMPMNPPDSGNGPNPPMSPPNNMTVNKQAGENISDDPQNPDMPDQEEGNDGFTIWKIKYVKESIKVILTY